MQTYYSDADGLPGRADVLDVAGDVWLAIPPALADGPEAELTARTPPAVPGDLAAVVAPAPFPAGGAPDASELPAECPEEGGISTAGESDHPERSHKAAAITPGRTSTPRHVSDKYTAGCELPGLDGERLGWRAGRDRDRGAWRR
jgi:hypothetical protein